MNKNLHDKIIEWGEDKGIFAHSNPLKQKEKTLEEVGEIKTAIDDLIDAIGDTQQHKNQ